jgi:heme/copper-type cytochrome/quinol oxidase subunit 2
VKLTLPRIVLVLSVAIFASGALLLVRAYWFADRPDLQVKVIGHAWWWEFDYPTLGIKSTEALHLPSNEKVRIELRSADVVHSFWIDGMGKPIDLPPGRSQQLDLIVKSPGELHGSCDAGCGCGSICMRFRVVASAPRDFDSWAARQKAAPSWLTMARDATPPACALDKTVDHQGSSRPSLPNTPSIQADKRAD